MLDESFKLFLIVALSFNPTLEECIPVKMTSSGDGTSNLKGSVLLLSEVPMLGKGRRTKPHISQNAILSSLSHTYHLHKQSKNEK